EVRMEPASDTDQSCCSFHLAVNPATDLFRYQDGFANRVHHFNLRPPHREVRILGASIVHTHPTTKSLDSSQATFPLNIELAPLEALEFLSFRGPVRETPRLAPVVEQLRPQAERRIAGFVLSVSHHIRKHFTYARHVTLSSSPIDVVLEHGKGVCQDFTH